MNSRRRARLICLAVVAGLYIFSVPWYRDTQSPLRLWFGLPDWVAVALLCYVGVAVFNAMAWMLCDVSDEMNDADERRAPASPAEDGGR